MALEETLKERSQSQCELCKSQEELSVYAVPPREGDNAENCIYICSVCLKDVESDGAPDPHHWRCLNDSMWSQEPAVQVIAWRLLNRLKNTDLLDMLYLEDPVLSWAKEGFSLSTEGQESSQHVDSNGSVLSAGDTVVLIKDLNVKGANFTAKRGTAVRGITLVSDNPEHIEGRVNGQKIVILTKFVKKS